VTDPAEVPDPEFGDMAEEWLVTFLDADDQPYGVDAVHRLYSFDGANHLVARYILVNMSDESLFAPYVSFELIPTLEGFQEYGGETSDFVDEEEIGYFYEADKYFGLKLLNEPFFSYRTPGYADFEEADDTDQFRYGEMSNDANSEFPIMDDYGLLVFFNAGDFEMGPGDSVTVYVAIGYEETLEGLQAEMAAAKQAYDDWAVGVTFENMVGAPKTITLGHNAPNPFHVSTTIPFAIHVDGTVAVEIMDVLGRGVATIDCGRLSEGIHEAVWDGQASDGEPAESGVYYYRLCVEESGDTHQLTGKMVLID
jgi:hypothetical protein